MISQAAQELTPDQRVIAFTVLEDLDSWLSKERWLKGGWFAFNKANADATGHHTECFANMIRRVELGGRRLNGHSPEDEEEAQNYADARSITERIVAEAIAELFPQQETRHMHFDRQKLTELGYSPGTYDLRRVETIEPEDCTLLHGKPCATCRHEAYKDEVTIAIQYGAFGEAQDGDPDAVIPSFNDHLGTRYADVQRVIDKARAMVTGIDITNAQDVLNEQEKMEMELASIQAQADIDIERLREFFDGREELGWFGVKRKLTERDVERRVKRIRMQAEKDKEVVRQDCVNCA